MFDDCRGFFKYGRFVHHRIDAGAVPRAEAGSAPGAGIGQRAAPARPRARPSDAAWAAAYMRSIIALPKPEQDTWVEPCISRAKS